MRRFLAFTLGLSLVATAAAAPSVAAGKSIYNANCAGCHGANAKGGVGPSLRNVMSWTLAQFRAALVAGKTPTRALKPTMPRFTNGFTPTTGKAPTDEQLKSLQLFIKSLKP